MTISDCRLAIEIEIANRKSQIESTNWGLIMKEIPLGNGLNAKVDDEDYEWLSRYSWYAYYVGRRVVKLNLNGTILVRH